MSFWITVWDELCQKDQAQKLFSNVQAWNLEGLLKCRFEGYSLNNRFISSKVSLGKFISSEFPRKVGSLLLWPCLESHWCKNNHRKQREELLLRRVSMVEVHTRDHECWWQGDFCRRYLAMTFIVVSFCTRFHMCFISSKPCKISE